MFKKLFAFGLILSLTLTQAHAITDNGLKYLSNVKAATKSEFGLSELVSNWVSQSKNLRGSINSLVKELQKN